MATAVLAHFIYTPKSGDRCLAVVPTEECIIVTWPNLSRHAVGRLQKVEVEAATQGRWFRNDARTVAKALIERVGGVAWDDRGQINMLVPAGWAEFAADVVMCAETMEMGRIQRVIDDAVSQAEKEALLRTNPVERQFAKLAKFKELEPSKVEGGYGHRATAEER